VCQEWKEMEEDGFCERFKNDDITAKDTSFELVCARQE